MQSHTKHTAVNCLGIKLDLNDSLYVIAKDATHGGGVAAEAVLARVFAAIGVAARAQGAHSNPKQACQHHTDRDPKGIDGCKRIARQLHTTECIRRKTENFVVCTLNAGRVDASEVFLATLALLMLQNWVATSNA